MYSHAKARTHRVWETRRRRRDKTRRDETKRNETKEKTRRAASSRRTWFETWRSLSTSFDGILSILDAPRLVSKRGGGGSPKRDRVSGGLKQNVSSQTVLDAEFDPGEIATHTRRECVSSQLPRTLVFPPHRICCRFVRSFLFHESPCIFPLLIFKRYTYYVYRGNIIARFAGYYICRGRNFERLSTRISRRRET